MQIFTRYVELPDVNVLLALFFVNHEFHQMATEWYRQTHAFATTPITEVGFLRLATNTVFDDAVSFADASGALQRLRNNRRWDFWPDDTSLVQPKISTKSISGSGQVTDMHLLNLAAERKGLLVTFDEKMLAPLGERERRSVRLLGR